MKRIPIRKLGTMIRMSVHLPTKHRLDLKLVKSRKSLDDEPLSIDLGKVKRSRKGNKISRIFKLIFENKRLKKLIVSSFAATIYVSSFVPAKASNIDQTTESIVQSPVVLETQTGIQYPLETVKITQGYSFFHPGIDFDGITGDPVYPIMTGVVEKIENSIFGYGKSILISHGNLKSLYAHLSEFNVSVGQEVTKSDVIGKVGTTGWAYGDHLHLEVYDSGKTINPLSILSY